MKQDEILFVITLPIMVVLVILSFKDMIPDLVKLLSIEYAWLFV
jgi:hypothetical protein